jgi:hypothetical protein
MFNLPDLTVLNRSIANNTRIAPTIHNNTMDEKKKYSMGNTQRLDQSNLLDLLGQLDFATSNNSSSGVIKGKSLSGDSFHLTAGVLKMKPGAKLPTEPPVYPPVAVPPPVEDPYVDETPVANDKDVSDGNTEPGYVPSEL